MTCTSKMEASRTPPKLTFNSLPARYRSEPDDLVKTPPLRAAMSVPFLWEDVPGKPREEPIFSTHKKSPVYVRRLDLPPRMVAEELKMKAGYNKNSAVSPTSVLNGPCPYAKKGAAWFQKKGRRGNEMDKLRRESDGSVSSLSSSSSHYSYHEEEKATNVKIRRFRRQRSLIHLSFNGVGTSYFWARIYESLKHVTPWHHN